MITKDQIKEAIHDVAKTVSLLEFVNLIPMEKAMLNERQRVASARNIKDTYEAVLKSYIAKDNISMVRGITYGGFEHSINDNWEAISMFQNEGKTVPYDNMKFRLLYDTNKEDNSEYVSDLNDDSIKAISYLEELKPNGDIKEMTHYLPDYYTTSDNTNYLTKYESNWSVRNIIDDFIARIILDLNRTIISSFAEATENANSKFNKAIRNSNYESEFIDATLLLAFRNRSNICEFFRDHVGERYSMDGRLISSVFICTEEEFFKIENSVVQKTVYPRNFIYDIDYTGMYNNKREVEFISGSRYFRSYLAGDILIFVLSSAPPNSDPILPVKGEGDQKFRYCYQFAVNNDLLGFFINGMTKEDVTKRITLDIADSIYNSLVVGRLSRDYRSANYGISSRGRADFAYVGSTIKRYKVKVD